MPKQKFSILTDTIPHQQSIEAAAERISPYVHHTPIHTCRSIDEMIGAKLFFKCENFQRIGAFKIRGATNAILQLEEKQQARGVTTHSSGNHAQAVALASKWRGINATIIMPRNANKVKKAAAKSYGAEIIECEPSNDSRQATMDAFIAKTGATFIPPFNDYRVITGQATVAKELLAQAHKLDALLAPVGGGGLISGTALSAKYFGNGTEVLAAEPARADDAYRSFQARELLPVEQPDTIADGLRTSLGDKTWGLIKDHVQDILTVEEEEIIAAMRLVWERMKLIVEPSSAVPIAAVLKNKNRFANKRVGVILSGGNVDVEKLPF